jgi:hypothetical protein
VPVFRQGLSRRSGRGFQGSRVHPVLVMNSPPMVGRSTGGRDLNHSDKRNLIVDEFRDKPARSVHTNPCPLAMSSVRCLCFRARVIMHH